MTGLYRPSDRSGDFPEAFISNLAFLVPNRCRRPRQLSPKWRVIRPKIVGSRDKPTSKMLWRGRRCQAAETWALVVATNYLGRAEPAYG